jgi:hypothetical protein
MLRKFAKRRGIAALTVVVALALAAGAYAFFTGSGGSGVGNATVGQATALAVTLDQPTGDSLLPGAGSNVFAYHVKNAGSGSQQVTTITAALKTDAAGGVFDTKSNSDVDTCKAAWFTVVNAPGTLPDVLAAGGVHEGSATVTMPANLTENQDACQGLTPEVIVSAS